MATQRDEFDPQPALLAALVDQIVIPTLTDFANKIGVTCEAAVSDLRYSAVTRYDDAIFMIDFRTGVYWPPANGSGEADAETGTQLLNALNAEFPELTCKNLVRMKEMVQQHQQNRERQARFTNP